MQYVIIESFNEAISLVTESNGDTAIWEDYKDAQVISKYCQNGIVVPLAPDLMDIIEEAVGFIDVALFELGEFEKESGPDGEDIDTIEDRLSNLLY